MRRGLSSLAVALVASAVAAQQPPQVFHVSTELVLLDLQVLDKHTHNPAPALEPSDLRVFEDGVPQQVQTISRDELPLSVVLLFDLTESDRGVLHHMADGAQAALTHLKPGDETAVMVYDESARLIDGLTTDRERTADAIVQAAATRADGEAYFNEAVYGAAMHLRQTGSPTGRKVVIWMTDNLPNVPGGRQHTEAEAIQVLQEDGVTVAPLLIADRMWSALAVPIKAAQAPFALKSPPGDANKYAELTGGEALSLRGNNVAERLAAMIDQLRARYTIGYKPSTPKPPGTYCKVRVELSPAGKLRPKEWKILTRQGYYRGGAATP